MPSREGLGRSCFLEGAHMNKYGFVANVALGLAVLVGGAPRCLSAQQMAAGSGIPTHLIVTVEPHHGSDVPAVNQTDVLVFEGKTRDEVTEWAPAQGDRGG